LYSRRFQPPIVRLDELLVPSADLVLDLRDWDADLGAGDFMDSVVYAAIVRHVAPLLIFEIGTGDGRTSLLAARNAPAGSRVHTLDPENSVNEVKGRVFRGRPEATMIEMHQGLSSSFEFSNWHGKCDLIFIDGSHQYDDVVVDTEIALRLVSERGWIVWHDVAFDTPSVAAALKVSRCASDVRLISGSRYAVMQSAWRQGTLSNGDVAPTRKLMKNASKRIGGRNHCAEFLG
jgi:predicted O-methyltransferase YrrM